VVYCIVVTCSCRPVWREELATSDFIFAGNNFVSFHQITMCTLSLFKCSTCQRLLFGTGVMTEVRMAMHFPNEVSQFFVQYRYEETFLVQVFEYCLYAIPNFH